MYANMLLCLLSKETRAEVEYNFFFHAHLAFRNRKIGGGDIYSCPFLLGREGASS